MQRGIWVHQWNQLAEQTPEEIAATLLPRGITYVFIKSHDGVYWMNQVYSHPMSPSSTNFGGLVSHFRDVGLGLVPWVVPRGYDAQSEAHAHAQAGELAGGSVIVDFEYHYEGFFDQGNMAAWLVYKETLLSQSLPWVACAPDPRQPTRDYLLNALDGFHAQLPQTYWHSFQQPWYVVLQNAYDTLAPLGQSIEMILDAGAPANEVADATRWCETMNFQAMSLWRMGTANAAVLDAFAGAPYVPPEPEPEPQPPGPTVDELLNALAYIKGPVTGTLRHYKLATIKAAVKEIDRVCAQYGIV